MATHHNKPEDIIKMVRQDEAKKVRVAVCDLDGVLRGKFLHRSKFTSVANDGFGFCDVVFGWDSADVCYDNTQFTGWHSGYPDAECMVDLGTFRKVPWLGGVPFFLADFGAPGSRAAELCPRRLLKRVIAKSEGMGFKPMFGMEFEWFNFKETPQSLADKGHTRPTPLTPGMFGYSLLRSSQNHEYFRAIMDEMEMFNVPIEGLHTETGPGVYEAALTYSDALEAGDRAVLFKAGVKEIAHRFGIMPSFMAKWNEKLPGCSGHMHQSLVSDDGANAFYDADAPFKMSDTFKHYLAGQLLLLPEVLPCYAPTINSYKRLVEGMWAPTKVTWGVDNRTVGLRVIPGSSKSTRLETRVSGSDVNPYVSIAAALACGLYGIENKLELRDVPVVGNGYAKEDAIRLPANLKEAAEKMAGSKVAREVLGDAFVDHLTQTRLWEWRQFQSVVTDWEMRRYFEII